MTSKHALIDGAVLIFKRPILSACTPKALRPVSMMPAVAAKNEESGLFLVIDPHG
ncbi:MAG: hypothetical protein OSB72_00100 [Gammaproteobacteria bacterium]|nr:hypothetical protein [Gammaproteobacteria bacterium]